MIEVHERVDKPRSLEPDHRLYLTHDQRSRARLKTNTATGEDVGIFLPHGQPLTVGEYLRSTCGKLIRVEGATEPITSASCEDSLLFSRACYHLGNRHVKIQITKSCLRITPDSVLEDMLQKLGLSVHHEMAVFIPENGAYHGLSQSHNHGGNHTHPHNETPHREQTETGKYS